MFAPLREQYALRTSAKQYAEHAAIRSEHALDIGAKVYQVIDRQQFKNILLKADALQCAVLMDTSISTRHCAVFNIKKGSFNKCNTCNMHYIYINIVQILSLYFSLGEYISHYFQGGGVWPGIWRQDRRVSRPSTSRDIRICSVYVCIYII